MRAFFGLGLFYFILLVDISRFANSLYYALVSLPIIMVPIFIVVSTLLGIDMISQDHRFGAGLANAHYAFLIYFCMLFVIYNAIHKGDFNFILYLLLFFLLLATGSRGPLLAIFIPSFMLVRFLLHKNVFHKLVAFSIPSLIVFYAVVESVIQRTFRESFNNVDGLNLSGREFAWEFFLSKVQGNNFFGGGLGSVNDITKGVSDYNLQLFTVPHNEFIRFYLELGWIGVIIFFTNIFFIFASVYKCSCSDTRNFIWLFGFGFFILTLFDNSFSTIQSFLPLALLLKYIVYKERLNYVFK